MPPEFRQQAKSGNQGKFGGASFQLRPSSLLTAFFLVFAAIILAYVAGVMSGRHAEREKADKAKAALSAPVESEAVKKEEILKPEQLEFVKILRDSSKASSSANREKEIGPQAPKTPQAETAQAAKPVEVTAGGEKTAKTEEQAERKAEAAEAETEIFDYVFQVGAFKDEAQADGLRQKLEGFGLRTALERNGKIFIVLVRMRGSASRTGELEEIAAQLRLGKPIQRSRKAARP